MLIFNARVEPEYLAFWNKDERAQYKKLNPHIASPPIYNPRPPLSLLHFPGDLTVPCQVKSQRISFISFAGRFTVNVCRPCN